MAERDAVRARSSTPFGSAYSVWSDRVGEDAAGSGMLDAWLQTVTPSSPFPVVRETGGAKFRHVPARYAGPVANWQMGESSHSRQQHDHETSSSPRRAAETKKLWEERPANPTDGTIMRSDMRRAVGGRRPVRTAMTKDAMDKFTARQQAREGEIPVYNSSGGKFSTITKQLGRSELDSEPSAAAAGLHHTLRTVVAENEIDEEVPDQHVLHSVSCSSSRVQARKLKVRTRRMVMP